MSAALSESDRALADKFAPVPALDLASPEQCAARSARILAAAERRQTRLGELCLAREINRRHGIRSTQELVTALNNLIASMEVTAGTDMEAWRQRLVDEACDLEDEVYEGNDSRPVSISKHIDGLSRAVSQREEFRNTP